LSDRQIELLDRVEHLEKRIDDLVDRLKSVRTN
jgi:hypothetical protein